MDPSESVVAPGKGAVTSAKVAEKCARISGQDAADEGGKLQQVLVSDADGRQHSAQKQYNVRSSSKGGVHSEAIADTRSALTWKVADGKKAAKARLMVKGYQGPDLKADNMDVAGCVSRRTSHLQVISLAATKKWKIRRLDIKNASRRSR